MNQSYVYKKQVDCSALHQGVNIPMSIRVVFQRNLQDFIHRGQSTDIFILMEGVTYKAKLVNQAFDSCKYPKRKDIFQIRYNTESEIAIRLRAIYQESYSYLLRQLDESNSGRRHIKLPEDKREYLAIYTTEFKDTFIFDCITKDINTGVKDYNEGEFEFFMNTPLVDHNATIELSTRVNKIRRLSLRLQTNSTSAIRHMDILSSISRSSEN